MAVMNLISSTAAAPHGPVTVAGIAFDNSYARLPSRFYARVEPTPVAAPRLVQLNHRLADELGLDPEALAGSEGVAMLSGNRLPAGAASLALAYAGHQFGHFVPQLGDGRALLLGEVIGRDGRRRDLQLKGSGQTPFSRRGDGRAALGPVLREYLVSEAMAALGIPTTRTLAAVITGERVMREAALPGAILTRVASSHLRVGTFQYFAARRDTEALQLLADYAMQRHYPEAAEATQPLGALIAAVAERQAALVASWLLVGFVHGVMNTDNASIAGETIDYGPCAFQDSYDPGMVLSAIDQMGRYAYANQPGIAHWNVVRFAETLLPLLADNENDSADLARAALAVFTPRFRAEYHSGLARKIGLPPSDPASAALAEDLLGRMAANHADFTLTFRRLAAAAIDPKADTGVRALFDDAEAYDTWATTWRARLAELGGEPWARHAAMQRANPAFIPRNHQVEAAIEDAQERGDFSRFETLLAVLARPYEDQPEYADFATPPRAEERVLQTFCGT